jgi:hypothetical protein
MTDERARRLHGERGASLILAVAFMVVVGAISAAVLATTTSGLQDRVALDQTRNREFAADAGIERSIVRIRQLATPGADANECTTADIYHYPTVNDVSLKNNPIRVNCANRPAVVIGPENTPLLQNDVVFTACPDTGASCTAATAIVNAQINFQGTGANTMTYVQAWSVQR